ncbi:MAG: hypothetical protein K8R50_03290 [Betaproteobacteria bacterium]|nr:hypothetical protein [Betaproteobacteria bacterium]
MINQMLGIQGADAPARRVDGRNEELDTKNARIPMPVNREDLKLEFDNK